MSKHCLEGLSSNRRGAGATAPGDQNGRYITGAVITVDGGQTLSWM